jgi:hypothetical protein
MNIFNLFKSNKTLVHECNETAVINITKYMDELSNLSLDLENLYDKYEDDEIICKIKLRDSNEILSDIKNLSIVNLFYIEYIRYTDSVMYNCKTNLCKYNVDEWEWEFNLSIIGSYYITLGWDFIEKSVGIVNNDKIRKSIDYMDSCIKIFRKSKYFINDIPQAGINEKIHKPGSYFNLLDIYLNNYENDKK